MFTPKQEEEQAEYIIKMYFLYRKMTRGLIACSFIVNMIFAFFVIYEGNFAVSLIFGLNVFVASWAYLKVSKEFPKKKKAIPKEVEPVV